MFDDSNIMTRKKFFYFKVIGWVSSRGATGLNLSSFELIELLIFGLGPGSGFGPIKNFELRASKKPGIIARAGPGSGSGLYNSA